MSNDPPVVQTTEPNNSGIPYSVAELRAAARNVGDRYCAAIMAWAASSIESGNRAIAAIVLDMPGQPKQLTISEASLKDAPAYVVITIWNPPTRSLTFRVIERSLVNHTMKE